LQALGQQWSDAIADLNGCHALTRGAYGFALWRTLAITPWDDLLEPTVAALRVGAGSAISAGQASFLPMADGPRLDRHGLQAGAGAAEARLATFYSAVEAGALRACMELEQLARWQDRAARETSDLSGRTPPRMIAAFLRFPVLSGDLVAAQTGCSRPAARRNLNILADRGLIREVTGQNRYRFWTVNS